VLGVALVTFAGLAATAHGFPVQHVSLNDGAIWVTDNSIGTVGRFAKPIAQLDAQLAPASPSSDVDVWQDGPVVAAYDATGGRIYAVNVYGPGLYDAGAAISPVANGIALGDTTLAEVTPKLEKLFAGWKAGQVPAKNLSTVKLGAEPVVYIVDKPGAGQSLIVVGHVSIPANTPQEIAIQAMNDDLGGAFSSRLNMNLREDKHWTYGAGSFFWNARAQRPLFIYAPVQTDKTKESLVEMTKEINGLVKDRPVTADELTRIQANETLSLPGSRETIGSVGFSILDILQYGWPDNYYETMAGKIRALKTTDLDAAAKQVIHPEAMVWVIVGDRAKIEQGIKDAGIGKIHFIDADGHPM